MHDSRLSPGGGAADSARLWPAAGHAKPQQAQTITHTSRLRLCPPRVIATGIDLHDPTLRAHGILRLVRVNEGLPYRDSLAKYAAAFFRMSRSSVTRFSSAFRQGFAAAWVQCFLGSGAIKALDPGVQTVGGCAQSPGDLCHGMTVRDHLPDGLLLELIGVSRTAHDYLQCLGVVRLRGIQESRGDSR